MGITGRYIEDYKHTSVSSKHTLCLMPSRAKAPPAQLPPIDPTMLFVTIPPLLILSVYFVRKWYLARRLRLHGIGRGAPGFQTNVKRIRITPQIKERLARGENVTPDEIAEASRKMDELEASSSGKDKSAPKNSSTTSLGGSLAGRGVMEEVQLGGSTTNTHTSGAWKEKEAVNEWLPEGLTTPKKRSGKGKKK